MTTAQDTPTLKAEKRERTGSRYAARIREQGLMPGVIYGHGEDVVSISLDAKEVWDTLHEHAHLLNIEVDGKSEPCLVKEVQWDHLGSKIIHIDLARVNLSEQVEVEVTLELVGEAKALETPGAVLNHERDVISVKCRADSIPELISLDITDLTVETAKTLADVTLPDGVELVDEPEMVLASINIVQEMPDEEEGEAADGAEPEVIGKQESDDNGDEA